MKWLIIVLTVAGYALVVWAVVSAWALAKRRLPVIRAREEAILAIARRPLPTDPQLLEEDRAGRERDRIDILREEGLGTYSYADLTVHPGLRIRRAGYEEILSNFRTQGLAALIGGLLSTIAGVLGAL